MKSMLKSVIRGAKAAVIAKKMFNIPSLKKEITKNFISELSKEVFILSKRKPASLFREGSLKIKSEKLYKDLQEKAPVLLEVLDSAGGKKSKMSTVLVAAMLLKNRNRQMARIPHLMAQVLDNAGTSDEV